jgi:hypothetical protein
MAKEPKPVKVVAVGGPGAGAGPMASLGVAAALVLFVVNAFMCIQVVSAILGIVSVVSGAGGLGGSTMFDVLGLVVGKIGGAASSISFMLYLDVVAFAFLGVALIFVRIKLKESGASPILAAVGAFAFAGVAFYLRFSLLPPIMSGFDQIAVAGMSPMALIKLAEIALNLMGFATIFLVQGIVFFIFGLFMRKTVNGLNKSYGKMARGGRLILTVSIMNLISMAALYYATTVLKTVISSLITTLSSGGSPSVDLNTLLPPVIALGIGIFLKLIIIPIMAMFAFLSLTFGFWGISKGPR